jgi:hypothetical protein
MKYVSPTLTPYSKGTANKGECVYTLSLRLLIRGYKSTK